MMFGRKKAYSAKEIVKVPCVRCGAPSFHQFQICALNRTHVPICQPCDVALNRLVLEFFKAPDIDQLMQAYTGETQEIKQ
jgi:hypothetical protein